MGFFFLNLISTDEKKRKLKNVAVRPWPSREHADRRYILHIRICEPL